MSALRARAPGKVNLCLFLGPSRPDGRHELVSLVQAVSLADELELGPAAPGARADELVCPEVEGPNLAARALAAFRSATGWDASPRRLTVTKRVPIAGGMGGGSADAAATLRLAARAAGGEADDPVLARLAGELGSDVPAALGGGLALVGGAGERVRPLTPRHPGGMVVIPLAQRLSTSEVFERADRLGLARDQSDLAERRAQVEAALEDGGELPTALAHNDLEAAARSLCPAIDAAIEAAREAGVQRPQVSGSGPTVFGALSGRGAPERARAVAARLRPRFPLAAAAAAVDSAYGVPEPVAVTA